MARDSYLSILFCVALLTIASCKPTSIRNETLSLEDLEGTWEGLAQSGFGDSRTTCNIRLPIKFVVANGRAISQSKYPQMEFNVPIGVDGGIAFKYRKAVKQSSDFPHTALHDIEFDGHLSLAEGGGRFVAAGCIGRWKVTKVTDKSEAITTEEGYAKLPLPKYVKLLHTHTVQEFGKPKFIVHKDDMLEVISRKICRSGRGECWKVRNVATGEVGYVSAVEMRRSHELVFE